MSKLRDDEAKKKALQEKNDVILAIGEEGQKGVKAAKEYFSQVEKTKQKEKSRHREILSEKKRFDTRCSFLAKLLMQQLDNIPWTPGWQYVVQPTDKGVVMLVISPTKRRFAEAFRPCGDDILDLNAVHKFALNAENTFDKVEGNRIGHRTTSGIYIPR